MATKYTSFSVAQGRITREWPSCMWLRLTPSTQISLQCLLPVSFLISYLIEGHFQTASPHYGWVGHNIKRIDTTNEARLCKLGRVFRKESAGGRRDGGQSSNKIANQHRHKSACSHHQILSGLLHDSCQTWAKSFSTTRVASMDILSQRDRSLERISMESVKVLFHLRSLVSRSVSWLYHHVLTPSSCLPFKHSDRLPLTSVSDLFFLLHIARIGSRDLSTTLLGNMPDVLRWMLECIVYVWLNPPQAFP